MSEKKKKNLRNQIREAHIHDRIRRREKEKKNEQKEEEEENQHWNGGRFDPGGRRFLSQHPSPDSRQKYIYRWKENKVTISLLFQQ